MNKYTNIKRIYYLIIKNMEKFYQNKQLSKYITQKTYLYSYMIPWITRIWIWIYSLFTERQYIVNDKDILIMIYFMIILWIIFTIIWIFSLNKKRNQEELEKKLELEWIRINAIISNIKPVWAVMHIWSLTILWRDSWFKIFATYKDLTFISPKISFNVPKYIKEWDTIPIFIDKEDSTKYFMDLDNINSL